MISTPKVTLANHISHMVSPYHVWFRELGYPQLDIVEFHDGEWAIRQFLRSPVVPHRTPWQWVLTKMRNVDKSYWICKKYAEQLDLEKKHFWDAQEKKEQQDMRDAESRELAFEANVENTMKSIRKNDALLNRVAKNGLKELGLRQLAKHIPNHHYRR